MFECNRYQDGIDTHNKFDIKLTAKASFIKNQNIRQDVYFSNFLYWGGVLWLQEEILLKKKENLKILL